MKPPSSQPHSCAIHITCFAMGQGESAISHCWAAACKRAPWPYPPLCPPSCSVANEMDIIVSFMENGIKAEWGLSDLGREQAERAGCAYPGRAHTPARAPVPPTTPCLPPTRNPAPCSERLLELLGRFDASRLRFYSSPFSRAVETAARAASHLEVHRTDDRFVLAPELRERGFGEEYELAPTSNYERVWEADVADSSARPPGAHAWRPGARQPLCVGASPPAGCSPLPLRPSAPCRYAPSLRAQAAARASMTWLRGCDCSWHASRRGTTGATSCWCRTATHFPSCRRSCAARRWARTGSTGCPTAASSSSPDRPPMCARGSAVVGALPQSLPTQPSSLPAGGTTVP